MCGPEDPLFTPLLPLARVPFQAKESVHKTPLLRKFGNFSLYSLNFHPNFISQAPKFGNFQLTSPQIWKFSAHKPPFSEANVSLQVPHFRNPGCTPLPEKKLSAPPPGCWPSCQHIIHVHFLLYYSVEWKQVYIILDADERTKSFSAIEMGGNGRQYCGLEMNTSVSYESHPH